MSDLEIAFQYSPLVLCDLKGKNKTDDVMRFYKESLSFDTMRRRLGLTHKNSWKLNRLLDDHKIHKRRDELVYTVFGMPDQHVPANNKEVWSIMMQVLKEQQPDIFLNFGDLDDALSFSFYDKNKRTPFDPRMRQKEVKAIVNAKNEIEECTENSLKVFLEGNHEYRARRFMEEGTNIKFQGMLEIFEIMDWSDWRVFEFGDKHNFRMGNLYCTHAHNHSLNTAKKTADNLRTDTMYGDTHTHQLFTVPDAKGQKVKAVTIGCGVDFDSPAVKYMKNSNPRWIHGFVLMTVDIFSGIWSYQFIEVIEGEAVALNKLWRA